MADYQLQIFTQEKMAFDGQVTSIVVPGEEGYLGVLANHAPLISTLGDGVLTIRTANKSTEYAISGGFLEVHRNRATILADRLTER